MSLPREPRQMMINMMYLVLTALLALNVSAEVLNAFHVVNEGITHSNAAVDKKNELTMTAFERQNKIDPVKTHALLLKAKQAKQLVDELTGQIQEYKDLIVEKSGGWTDKDGKTQTKGWSPEKGELVDDKNLDVSTGVMVEEGRAAKLKEQIEDTRTQLLGLIDDRMQRKGIEEQLPMKIDKPRKNADGQELTWEAANFQMVPTIACMTLLNKFQNDAKNSEAQVIDNLFSSIYEYVQKIDTMEAKVVAPNSYVMAGQDYKADIFVAAYSKSLVPKVYVGALTGVKKDKDGNYPKVKQNPLVGGGKGLEVVDGIGKYEVRANGEGAQTYTGAIMVTDPDGTPAYYPFESSYISAKGSAVVSSDNLNFIYAGIPNPFSVSVPGFDASKVIALSSGGSFTGSGGRYVANMPGNLVGRTININVSVKSNDKTLLLSSQPFKVKAVPPPIAKVAGLTQGTIKTGELRASSGPIATLENFYFQGVSFTITSYEFVWIPQHGGDIYVRPTTGQPWDNAVKAKFPDIRPGDRILLQNIRAQGPGGYMYNLGPVSLQVK